MAGNPAGETELKRTEGTRSAVTSHDQEEGSAKPQVAAAGPGLVKSRPLPPSRPRQGQAAPEVGGTDESQARLLEPGILL